MGGGEVGKSLRVLIMDDDEMVRGILKKIFLFLKCEVDDVCNGEEAIEKYRSSITADQCYDLVVLDIRINNGMGGVEAAQEIKQIHSNAYLVVSSGDSVDQVMDNYTDYNFSAMLTKPFTFDSVSALLDNVGNTKDG
ncbi:MAG: response regulator [Desulfobulbaceae bacterium]|nr:response regulator [Desulfobulbaceae bacterium]